MPEKKTPLWLWPNLLSLDAPIVALVWLYMFKRAWHVNYLPWQSYLALGLAVWVVYVADRLLDHRIRPAEDPHIGARHAFHYKHRRLFQVGVLSALATIVFLVFKVLPSELIVDFSRGIRPLPFDFIFSYAGMGLLLVVLFFSMVLVSADTQEIPYLRNLVAGMAFGYGTAIMAHVYAPTQGVWELIRNSWELRAFGILCVLNITAIHLWERSRMTSDPDKKAGYEMILTVMLIALAGFALAFAYHHNPGLFGRDDAADQAQQRPFFYAILISAALLQIVNRNRSRFSLDGLRTLADLALIIPLPLFLIFERG